MNYIKPTLEVVDFEAVNVIMGSPDTDLELPDFDDEYNTGEGQSVSGNFYN